MKQQGSISELTARALESQWRNGTAYATVKLIEQPGTATYDIDLDWTARPSISIVRTWGKQMRPRELERFTRRADLGGEWRRLPDDDEQ